MNHIFAIVGSFLLAVPTASFAEYSERLYDMRPSCSLKGSLTFRVSDAEKSGSDIWKGLAEIRCGIIAPICNQVVEVSYESDLTTFFEEYGFAEMGSLKISIEPLPTPNGYKDFLGGLVLIKAPRDSVTPESANRFELLNWPTRDRRRVKSGPLLIQSVQFTISNSRVQGTNLLSKALERGSLLIRESEIYGCANYREQP